VPLLFYIAEVYLIVYRHTIITKFSLRRFWKSIVRKTELEL